MFTHHMWVYSTLDPVIQDLSRGNAPPYTKLRLSFGVLLVLAQLRIGWAHLEVEQGHKRRPKVPGRRAYAACVLGMMLPSLCGRLFQLGLDSLHTLRIWSIVYVDI
jgi:hypothetical protein